MRCWKPGHERFIVFLSFEEVVAKRWSQTCDIIVVYDIKSQRVPQINARLNFHTDAFMNNNNNNMVQQIY